MLGRMTTFSRAFVIPGFLMDFIKKQYLLAMTLQLLYHLYNTWRPGLCNTVSQVRCGIATPQGIVLVHSGGSGMNGSRTYGRIGDIYVSGDRL